ncbi:hypothetical protein CB1_000849054 [Camelus ferus]|nr:hypothetical protein CB1_000849054 [Camelus ferus]
MPRTHCCRSGGALPSVMSEQSIVLSTGATWSFCPTVLPITGRYQLGSGLKTPLSAQPRPIKTNLAHTVVSGASHTGSQTGPRRMPVAVRQTDIGENADARGPQLQLFLALIGRNRILCSTVELRHRK